MEKRTLPIEKSKRKKNILEDEVFLRNIQGQTGEIEELKGLFLEYYIRGEIKQLNSLAFEIKEKYNSKLEIYKNKEFEYISLCLDALDFFLKYSDKYQDFCNEFYDLVKSRLTPEVLTNLSGSILIFKIIRLSKKMEDIGFSDKVYDDFLIIEESKMDEIVKQSVKTQGPSGNLSVDFDISLLLSRINSALHWFIFAGENGILFSQQELCIVGELFFNLQNKNKFLENELKRVWKHIFNEDFNEFNLDKQREHLKGIKNGRRD
ncbi:hypothetical protein KO317_01955 [Candidatus Micrarchaeota archaeon]|nr:hypothetical protein [Candidatus Micrarchaeota archaeon]